MILYEAFCQTNPTTTEFTLAVLLTSIVALCTISSVIILYTLLYTVNRRTAYRLKTDEAFERQEKREEDVLRILTYLAFATKKRTLASYSKNVSATDLTAHLNNCEFINERDAASVEIVNFFGLDPAERSQTKSGGGERKFRGKIISRDTEFNRSLQFIKDDQKHEFNKIKARSSIYFPVS